MSADPIGFAGEDANLYRYVINDPINFTDASGLLRNPWSITEEARSHPNSIGDKDDRNSPKSRAANAFKHCLASCIQTAENGYPFASLAGDVVETSQLTIGYDNLGESLKDLINNKIGRDFGKCFSDIWRVDEETSRKIVNQCVKSCKTALNTGLLQTEPL